MSDPSTDLTLIEPFTIHVAEASLERIKERVRTFPWRAWSDAPGAEDWRNGPPSTFMRALCAYWTEHYDWREQERAMNTLPHYRTMLDDMSIHFVHERGSGEAPAPLLIAHGWPYSFHSYDGLIDKLAHPERNGGRAEDAFSVVVPSYPGYDFSGRPTAPMGPHATALLFDQLMARLGYDRYFVHGGDWGAHVTSILGLHRSERVIGIHATALALREAGAEQLTGETPADATEEERAFASAEYAVWRREGAYSLIQATKPAKLGYAMLDSPVGLAAWIIEALHAWSDRETRRFEEVFTFDQLLTEVMLYLVTDAFPTSIWIYGAKQQEEMTVPSGQRIAVPTALAAFRDPVFPVPPREVAQRSHNVVRYTHMQHGGHFPFYEAPDLLINDLRAFRKLVLC